MQGIDGFGCQRHHSVVAEQEALLRVVPEWAEVVDHGWSLPARRLVSNRRTGRSRINREPSSVSPRVSKGMVNRSPQTSCDTRTTLESRPVIRYGELMWSSRPNQLRP